MTRKEWSWKGGVGEGEAARKEERRQRKGQSQTEERIEQQVRRIISF